MRYYFHFSNWNDFFDFWVFFIYYWFTDVGIFKSVLRFFNKMRIFVLKKCQKKQTCSSSFLKMFGESPNENKTKLEKFQAHYTRKKVSMKNRKGRSE